MEFVEAYKPHLCECLCDTLPMGGQTEKRIRKSVDRTLGFLNEVIKAKQTNEVTFISEVIIISITVVE